jgi:hypothetical protein
MMTTEPLLLIMAFSNCAFAFEAMDWIRSYVEAGRYPEPPDTMIMSPRHAIVGGQGPAEMPGAG